tara:strand:+ start:162 stop:392 length:231 start_codon:yes stop_codon:yes gene_type:complete
LAAMPERPEESLERLLLAEDWLGDATLRQQGQWAARAWRLESVLSDGLDCPWDDPERSPEAIRRTGFQPRAILPSN